MKNGNYSCESNYCSVSCAFQFHDFLFFFLFGVPRLEDLKLTMALLCGAIPPEPVEGGIASHSGVREISVKLD